MQAQQPQNTFHAHGFKLCVIEKKLRCGIVQIIIPVSILTFAVSNLHYPLPLIPSFSAMVTPLFLVLRGNLILAIKVGDMSQVLEPLDETYSLFLVPEMQ